MRKTSGKYFLCISFVLFCFFFFFLFSFSNSTHSEKKIIIVSKKKKEKMFACNVEFFIRNVPTQTRFYRIDGLFFFLSFIVRFFFLIPTREPCDFFLLYFFFWLFNVLCCESFAEMSQLKIFRLIVSAYMYDGYVLWMGWRARARARYERGCRKKRKENRILFMLAGSVNLWNLYRSMHSGCNTLSRNYIGSVGFIILILSLNTKIIYGGTKSIYGPLKRWSFRMINFWFNRITIGVDRSNDILITLILEFRIILFFGVGGERRGKKRQKCYEKIVLSFKEYIARDNKTLSKRYNDC